MGGDAARPVFEYLERLGDADSEAPVPLSGAETAQLSGTYSLGAGETNQIDVDGNTKPYAGKMYTWAPQLNWTRRGTMTRPLFHLGGLAFYPGGAPAVRICFTVEEDKVAMAVSDGEIQVSAIRL